MIFILALYFSVLLTTLLVLPLMRFGLRIGMVDVPCARKIHSEITPRTGGIALVIGTLIPFVFVVQFTPAVLGICLGGLCIVALGILDDLKGLNYQWKFLGQTAAASITLYVSGFQFIDLRQLWPGCAVNSEALTFLLGILFLVATINIINLADGLDGLAGGICLLIFTSTAFLAYLQNDFQSLIFDACILGAIVGFLRYNSHPAVVFLGDTGSQFLGYVVGVAMLWLPRGSMQYSPLLPLFIIGIPVLDTAFVMLERFIEHRPLFKADKMHLHHKLLKMGFKHNHAVVIIYGIQLGMILVGWSLRRQSDGVLLAFYMVFIGTFMMILLFYRSKREPTWQFQKPLPGIPLGLKAKSALHRSTGLLSELAWYLLSITLCVFYFVSPFWTRPIPKEVGVCSLGLAVILVLLNALRRDILRDFIGFCVYFTSLYYILAIDLDDPVLWVQNKAGIYFILFLIIGLSYCLYIITTMEELPVFAMDYLLLGIVILTFFLPEVYLNKFHIHTIAIKVLLIFLSVKLISYKLQNRIALLTPLVVLLLGLNFVMSFWPWVI